MPKSERLNHRCIRNGFDVFNRCFTDYLRDVRDDLMYGYHRRNRTADVQRTEINHMVDVKVLYQDAMLVKWVSLTVL